MEDLDDDEEEEDGMHGTWDEDERPTELELEQDSRVSFIALRSPTLKGETGKPGTAPTGDVECGEKEGVVGQSRGRDRTGLGAGGGGKAGRTRGPVSSCCCTHKPTRRTFAPPAGPRKMPDANFKNYK